MPLLCWFAICFYTIFPDFAFADAGIPTVFVTLPAMLVALILVVGLENLLLSRLIKLPFSATIKAVGIANLISTIIGFPLASITQALVGTIVDLLPSSPFTQILNLAFFGGVFIASPGPLEYPRSDWEMPLALIIMLGFYLIASWLIELLILKYLMKRPARLLLRPVLFCNIASYTILLIVVFTLMKFGVKT